MRIGFVTGEYPPLRGGVGDYTRLLALHLAARGAEIHILTGRAGQRSDAGITVYPRIGHWSIGVLGQARRWAQEQNLDIAHLQFQTAAFGMSPWVHFLPLLLRRPTFTTFHDLRAPYLFPKAGPLRAASVRWLARTSTGVIVTGPGDRAALPTHPYIAEIPVGSNILAPLPANYDRAATRAQYGAGPADFVLAHFGFTHVSKGLATLLTALANLRQDGVPAQLWLVGASLGDSDPRNREAQEELQGQIRALGLADSVRASGYLEEAAVRAALTAADVVVLPYREGAAYHHGSLQAAIHAGCAIISTTPQSPASRFRNGHNMRLVPPADAVALTEAILELRRHPETRAALQAGARALAAEFSWEGIAAQHEAFYREVLESPR